MLTGYGPFRDHKINASWEAVKVVQQIWDKKEVFKILILCRAKEDLVTFDFSKTNACMC